MSHQTTAGGTLKNYIYATQETHSHASSGMLITSVFTTYSIMQTTNVTHDKF